MVVFGHCTDFFYGRFGVQLFFLISGFLIYRNLSGFAEKKVFLWNRFLRLFPTSFFFLIFFYWGYFSSITEKIANILLVQSGFYFWNSFPGGWSISNEWFFSLFLVFIPQYFFSKNRIKITVAFLLGFQILLSILAFVNGGLDYTFANPDKRNLWLNTTNPIGNMAAFCLGIYAKYLPEKSCRRRLLLLFFLFGLIFDYYVGHLLSLQIFSIYCLFRLVQSFPVPHLICKPLSFIGERTYGIFFVHFPILEYFIEKNKLFLLTENAVINKMLLFFTVFVISIFSADLVFRLIEKTFLKLKVKY